MDLLWVASSDLTAFSVSANVKLRVLWQTCWGWYGSHICKCMLLSFLVLFSAILFPLCDQNVVLELFALFCACNHSANLIFGLPKDVLEQKHRVDLVSGLLVVPHGTSRSKFLLCDLGSMENIFLIYMLL